MKTTTKTTTGFTVGARVIGVDDWRYAGRTGTVVQETRHACTTVLFDDGVTEYVRTAVLAGGAS